MPDSISVVIPCYNHAVFLPEAIESVFHQTCPGLEVIVVDDGSTDETERVAQNYAGVRYVKQNRQGVSTARNTGLRCCRGDYVVFLDADDRLLPNHFQKSLQAFTEWPKAALVCGDFRLFGPEQERRSHRCDPQPDYYATLLRFNFIGAVHAAMFRRDVLLELGGFLVQLHACEDYELYFRLARDYPIHCHHEQVAEYRRHRSQMSRRWDVMLKCALSVLRAQWPHVKDNAYYRDAYWEGIKRLQATYGGPLSWQMVTAAKQGHGRIAFKYFRTLLDHYPRGLALLIQQKFLQGWMREPS